MWRHSVRPLSSFLARRTSTSRPLLPVASRIARCSLSTSLRPTLTLTPTSWRPSFPRSTLVHVPPLMMVPHAARRWLCSFIPVRSDAYQMPIKSFYVARSIDFVRLVQHEMPNHKATLQKDSVAIALPDSSTSYMVIYRYGSVVFFNYQPQHLQLLKSIRQYGEEPFPTPRSEDYLVSVNPQLEEWFRHRPGEEGISVQQLDLSNLLVISQVLGQTVALHHYEHRVDHMVATFTELNVSLEKARRSFSMKPASLFKLVAENNRLLTDIITKIGILDRFTVAWNHARYSGLFESLRDEFELEERFKSVDFKLNVIQMNTKFFLEVVHNQKSDRLEWIIILLIATEIVLSLYNMYERQMEKKAELEAALAAATQAAAAGPVDQTSNSSMLIAPKAKRDSHSSH